jgi:hypothetical protein
MRGSFFIFRERTCKLKNISRHLFSFPSIGVNAFFYKIHVKTSCLISEVSTFLIHSESTGKGKIMDEIEAGFKKLEQKIEEMQEKGDSLSQEVRDHESDLLTRMAKSVVPIVKVVGLNMLKKGKQDTKGEIYDPAYFPGKMIILGKAVKPAAARPDNPQMPVTDQFCVLSEEGKFFELMYSFDGFLTDSYLNPINPKTAIENYGYDIMFMLYRAMHDYLKGEEALVEALEKVLGYIYSRNS